MSLHVLSPLNFDQIAGAVMRAIPFAKMDVKGDSLLVSHGRQQVRVVLEAWGPLDTSFGSIRSKVSFYSIEPPEGKEPLEKTMASEVRLGETVRAAIRALRPLETCDGGGKVIPQGTY